MPALNEMMSNTPAISDIETIPKKVLTHIVTVTNINNPKPNKIIFEDLNFIDATINTEPMSIGNTGPPAATIALPKFPKNKLPL